MIDRKLKLLVSHIDVAIRKEGTWGGVLFDHFLLAFVDNVRVAEQVIPSVMSADVFLGNDDFGLLSLDIFVDELLITEFIIGASCLTMIRLVRLDISDDLELLL